MTARAKMCGPLTSARVHRISVIALGVLLASCRCVFALDPSLDVSQYAHTAWTIREGFGNGPINTIAQTPDGYLWLGTDFGLLRFDGVRAVPWNPPENQQLPSSHVMRLLTARDGTLWIGTTNGLASWKNGRLTAYAELKDRLIGALLEDRKGSIWATGLSFARGRNGALCEITNGHVRCEGDDGRLGRGAFGLYQDSKGNLWLGALQGRLWRWAPGTPQLFRVPDPDGVQGFADDDRGALLITSGGRLTRFVEGRLEAISLPGVSVDDRPRHLLRDRDGALWMGTTGGGLLHLHAGRVDRFVKNDGLSGDWADVLFEDREGTIWVATTMGLDRFHERTVPAMTARQAMSDTMASSFSTGIDGSVWVATTEGLRRWQQGDVTAYRDAHSRSANVSVHVRDIPHSGLQGRVVASQFVDHRGRLWLSTLDGVGTFARDRFVPVPGVPGGVIHAIGEDVGGNVWVANQELGLYRIAPDGHIDRFPLEAFGGGYALSLVGDSYKNGIWLGFADGGIVYFADGQIRSRYGVNDGLGAGMVTALRFDRQDALWAATQGGLSRLKDGHISTLTAKQGLPCDAVHWDIDDNAQALWVKTACGLARIARSEIDAWTADPRQTVRPRILDAWDGVMISALPGFFTPQVTKSSDGRLWFPAVDGVSVLDPRQLPTNTVPPPVHVEQITADRKAYDVASDIVHLPPLIRDLQIDYTALSLVAPEKNRFRIKLEGWDPEWQDVGTRRQAFYSNLPPRNYRLRVIASNNSGVWNETGAALDFAIAPAYYQTAGFRTLAVVMFVSLLWAAYRIRLRVIERHEGEITALNDSLMKAQEQERMRIAGELHDGVMQQISALSLMLGTGKRQPDADAKKTMADVQRRLIEVGTEVRQLSHNLHPPMLKDAGLPEALRGYCEEFSRVRNIPVSCHADDRVQDLSRGAALAVYRIAQEAMGNAVTHGAAQHVDVRVARSNGLVALTVTDDGKGFDANRIGLRGLGLINMRERARQLNGTFELDSEPGRGTTVRVTIPFRRAV